MESKTPVLLPRKAPPKSKTNFLNQPEQRRKEKPRLSSPPIPTHPKEANFQLPQSHRSRTEGVAAAFRNRRRRRRPATPSPPSRDSHGKAAPQLSSGVSGEGGRKKKGGGLPRRGPEKQPCALPRLRATGERASSFSSEPTGRAPSWTAPRRASRDGRPASFPSDLIREGGRKRPFWRAGRPLALQARLGFAQSSPQRH